MYAKKIYKWQLSYSLLIVMFCISANAEHINKSKARSQTREERSPQTICTMMTQTFLLTLVMVLPDNSEKLVYRLVQLMSYLLAICTLTTPAVCLPFWDNVTKRATLVL